MNKISIALCTYNGEKFLAAQLESILGQTRMPDELVICDDRSSDRTTALINEFSAAAPFPVHLHINESNLGSTLNFQAAIKRCTGDLIFLCDQDDLWLPEKLAAMEAAFDVSENTGLVFSDAELINEDGKSLGENLWDYSFVPLERKRARAGRFFEVEVRQNVVTGATMAFRSALQEFFLPFPLDLPNTIHDAWIALIISAKMNVVFLERPLIKYRQHSGQQLGVNWKLKYFSRQESYSQSIFFLQEDLKRLTRLKELAGIHPQLRNAAGSTDLTKMIDQIEDEKLQMIEHYRVRKDLSQSRLKRSLPVMKEIFSGRYHRFSKGFFSAVKDIKDTW